MAENKTAKADKPMTKSAVYQQLADSTKLTRKQVAEVFDALTALIKRELGKKGPGVFTIPGMLKLRLQRKPAVRGGKQVPNPFKPGEMMTTKPKPARNVVRARPLKTLNELIK
jgi:nucleoid DNA-binding protein